MDFAFFPCIVIGSGVTGLTSAIYLGQASISCMVMEGKHPGGALMQSSSVQNWPGVINEPGKNIISKIRSQALHGGAELFHTVVQHVDFVKYRPLFGLITKEVHPEYQ